MNTKPKAAKALRWVDGVGTTLVPVTLIRRSGRSAWIRLEDGTEVRTCSEYVI